MTEPVLLHSESHGVRTLTMNRPDAYNSLTTEMKERLLTELREATADDSVRAVVLTGAGKAFCAGQDLKEHITALTTGDDAPLRTVAEHYTPIVQAITTMGKPVIAAVNGTAAGAGAALAYASDLRVAARSAKFLMAFANVGLSADSGASWTLPRLIGYGRAMEMMLLAEPVTAERAWEIGMVTRVVDDDSLAAETHELAERMATGPTSAYAAIKEAMHEAAGGDLDHALDVEGRTQNALGRTSDHGEAVDAFVAKRSPNFTGK